MTNPYYTAGTFVPNSQVRSSQFQAEFDAIETGFDGLYASVGGGASSASSVTIGTGSKTFVLTTGKFVLGQFVLAVSTASPANLVFGQVTAMNTTTKQCTINVTYTSGSGTFSAWTLSLGPPGTVTFTAASTDTLFNKTINGADNTINIRLANDVSGLLPVANGGTALASYTTGDLIYASGATTLAARAAVATGNALISGGVGVAPSWGKIGLTTHVSGTLPVANGGTGSTATAYCNLTANVTGTLPVANGGTGQTTYTNGQLLIGNTTGGTLNKATLTAGSGITVTNGAGAITIASAVPQAVNGSSLFMGTGVSQNGTNSVAIGVGAGAALTASSSQLVLLGTNAGAALTGTVSFRSVAIGHNALTAETGGQNSVAIGWNALSSQNVGTGFAGNVAIGAGQAGPSISTGTNNTLVGGGAGIGGTYTTASNNTIIGPYTGTASNTNGEIAIATGSGTRRFWHDGADAFISHNTTASAANAFLDSVTSSLRRSTSSLRYKRDVEPLWPDESAKLLKLKPVFYRSKCDADPEAWSYYGVIAEEADQLGLQRLVQYEYAPEDYGEPDENNERWPKPDAKKVPGGFAYDRMTVLLLDLVQRQQAQIENLTARLEALEA